MLKIMSFLLPGETEVLQLKLESNSLYVYAYWVNKADSDVVRATFVHLVASFKKINS